MSLGTRLYDALDIAFRCAGRQSEDRYYDTNVDTIVVLTDGAPIVNGKRDSPPRIRSAVKRWNLNERVVLHIIGLGDQIPKFMQLLAEDNGGQFAQHK
ncbi:MAG: hypothetical protein ACI841_000638 [Planctomycetota bacterium]|jgi:hypothetical protein